MPVVLFENQQEVSDADLAAQWHSYICSTASIKLSFSDS